MRILLFLCLYFPLASFAAPSDSDNSMVAIDAMYGITSVANSNLNSAREAFVWNSVRATDGSLKSPNYQAFALGFHIIPDLWMRLRYESESQKLTPTSIGGAGTIQDSFVYRSVSLLFDVPIPLSESWSLGFGLGIGEALTYEFHQKESPGEDVTWQGRPMTFRVGASASYMFAGFLGAFLEIYDEQVSSELKAKTNYATTIGGTPIASGQKFTNVSTGANAKMDLSGMHYGLGLRIQF